MTEKSTEELTRSELPHQVDVQWAVQAESWMPDNADICRWACEVLRNLGGDGQPAEVCVRIVSESEIKGLNRDYRDVNKITNVLAFPQSIGLDVGANLLGDIVICAPVVVSEAQTQVKEPRAHFAHLIIHGMLHLLGYDHVENEEAEEMQDVTETIVTPAIEPLEATVEETTYDFDTDTSTTATVANPLIVKDDEERAAAQAVIDATPQPVKDHVNG